MIPINVENSYISASTDESVSLPIDESDGAQAIAEKVIGLKTFELDSEETVYDSERKAYTSNSKKVNFQANLNSQSATNKILIT